MCSCNQWAIHHLFSTFKETSSCVPDAEWCHQHDTKIYDNLTLVRKTMVCYNNMFWLYLFHDVFFHQELIGITILGWQCPDPNSSSFVPVVLRLKYILVTLLWNWLLKDIILHEYVLTISTKVWASEADEDISYNDLNVRFFTTCLKV